MRISNSTLKRKRLSDLTTGRHFSTAHRIPGSPHQDFSQPPTPVTEFDTGVSHHATARSFWEKF